MSDNTYTTNNAEVILEIKDLCKSFGDHEVLKGISTTIRKGDVLALIGPSGCGKSTFLRSLNLLEIPTSGHVLFEGTDMTDKSVDINHVREKIGMVFQQFNLFPNMTIKENIMLAPVKLNKMTREEAEKKAMELLKVFDLDKEAGFLASNLPYGKQRKLEIARALATNPKLLLLDEPAAGMNPNETKELMETIHFVRDEFDMTVLLIEHDMKLVSGICEELTVLNFGQVLAQGKTSDVLNDPQVIKAYLGE